MSEEAQQHEQQPMKFGGCCSLVLTFPKKEDKAEQQQDENINGVCCE